MNEKIAKELDKIPIEKLYDVFGEIKELVTAILTEHQRKVEAQANELQSKINRISGTD